MYYLNIYFKSCKCQHLILLSNLLIYAQNDLGQKLLDLFFRLLNT